ncbi:TPA: recombinase family protein [Vibrio parahaemolyticus]|uniref:recombinase family protein n=1 Tax=Vibrio TaxID=662 RepID=UPI00146A0B8E|nr:recombinase family protein [Vibrio furnissii]EKB1969670.1 recombinase family protein [Vibrio parahaemolyticus]MDF5089547.1 recombinase family protein [Vibrio parahaemolyticus]MDF5138105.1 recombinase family protein [Vibrio parahaemolyticus]NMU20409.1 recombinase family protein [Vibrio parahaemolyticus]NMU57734.1 recombinase family protein [Vibrio parahaemolyticus]
MITAYSYLRLSTKEQIKGDGVRRQMEATERACKENGWQLSKTTFRDLGRSAYHGHHLKHGDFGTILQLIKEGVIASGSVLILENVDRMSRQDPQESVYMMLDIIRAGVKIYTLHDKRLHEREGNDNFMNLMVWALAAERAHDESRVKSERVRQAKAEKRKQAREEGKAIIGRVPSWIRKVTPKGGEPYYELDEERAEVVRLIFQLKLDGYGLGAITNELIKRGIPPMGNRNVRKDLAPKWQVSTIRKWLRSPTVYGQYQPHIRVDGKKVPEGDPIDNFYPAAVDRETFLKVQSVLGKHSRGRTAEEGENLLRGLLRCACGGNLSLHITKRGDKRYKYLRCNHDFMDSCQSKRFDYDGVESLILRAVHSIDWVDVLNVQSGKNKDSIKSLRERRDVLVADLEETNKRMLNLSNQLEVMDEPSAFLLNRLSELEKGAQEKQSDLEAIENELSSVERVEEEADNKFRNNSFEIVELLGSTTTQIEKEDMVKRRVKMNAVLRRELDHILVTKVDDQDWWVWSAVTTGGVPLFDLKINAKASNGIIESEYSTMPELHYYKVDRRKYNRVNRKQVGLVDSVELKS